MAASTGKPEAPSVQGGMAAPRAVDRLRVGVYVLQKGRLRYVDRRLSEILGYEDPGALIGCCFWQVVHPEDRRRVCLVDGRRGAFRCLKADGGVTWVQMSGVHMHLDAKPANVGCLMEMGPLAERGAVQGETSVYQAHLEAIHNSIDAAVIGQSDSMREVRRHLEKLADRETPVLITGEIGTGKEFIARALHFRGRRAAKPFVRVNCSALAESLLESELFGHVQGAFTGALQDKWGRIQEAEGGTIVLDGIGELSPLLQCKLLQVLQEKAFGRVGESVSRRLDVRIVACTDKDLREKVRSGDFREDLCRRLKAVEILLPPLRARIEDVPLLAEHFRRTFNARLKKGIGPLCEEVLGLLKAYAWPGNVRELEYVLERAFLLCASRDITGEHLPAGIGNRRKQADGPVIIPIHAAEGARDVIEALSRVCWNRTKAAELLGVSRQTLYRKIHAYKIFETK